jgi:hypothetical protein
VLTFALLAPCTLVACSGEPFGYDPGLAGKPARERPARATQAEPSAKPRDPLPATGFACHASGDLVAFDPETGNTLARHAFGPEVIDLDWDERTQRLLLTSVERFDVEGSRVHALSFDGSAFTHEASSEVFPGEVRVLSSPARVVVVGVELSSHWYELDDDLAVVGPSGALPQPSLVAEPDASAVLALRRESLADVVYRVSGFAEGWSSVELALPRAAPERGVVIARSGEHSWLLGRGDSPEGFRVASLRTAGLSLARAPIFRNVPGSCGTGALYSLGVGAAGDALVTITGAALDQLAVVSTSPGGITHCIRLRAPLARAGAWIPRNLMLDPGQRQAWVATKRGVESFALDPPAPERSSFAGTELRAPMTLAR